MQVANLLRTSTRERLQYLRMTDTQEVISLTFVHVIYMYEIVDCASRILKSSSILNELSEDALCNIVPVVSTRTSNLTETVKPWKLCRLAFSILTRIFMHICT